MSFVSHIFSVNTYIIVSISSIPLSLYIHMPWCIQKCPYCDFNSHEIRGVFQKGLPEHDYITQLLTDLDNDIIRFNETRPLLSIFIGGGTPSLFSGSAIQRLLDGIRKRSMITPTTEITLEANPGTVDEKYFADYYRAGINRISIGIQSFDNKQLKKLGRIHSADDAIRAVRTAQDAKFDNINIDLMFGLPQQTEEQAISDIKKGIALRTEHLSYYQLTVESNTAFAHCPPVLPSEDIIDQHFQDASELLHSGGFQRYEVSAWSRGRQSKHNRNYWEYGDYLGIGAGAHGKITISSKGKPLIVRTTKPRSPKQYLNADMMRNERWVREHEKAFELMLNTMRLMGGFDRQIITERGLVAEETVMPILIKLTEKGLLIIGEKKIMPTNLGNRFINDMTEAFLSN
ncbi:MAG: radical SAM family heme chaperone HemW [Ostreibacterium sp.]